MRYDGENGKIQISLREFVSIARRGISPSLSYDEDEPNIGAPSARRLSQITGENTAERLYYAFSYEGYDFELSAIAESVDGNSITVAREIESSPAHPKKSEIAEIRGEGYILAYMLSKMQNYSECDIKFVYINPASGEFAEVTESVTLGKLSSFFEKCLKTLKVYARPEVERVTERLPSMKGVKFPYSNIREGQSEFVRTAYRTLSRGGALYASAPTGTGKTVSALYPAIRALGDGRVEKVFYLTPKATTAEAARECLMLMAESGANIRALILTAKEKSCAEGHLCRVSRKLCKNSQCNKMSDAVLELYSQKKTVVTIRDVRSVSEKYTVCPYELSLTYAELCDVVICDFNYLFDPTVYIRRFFTEGGKYAFLIDEAHNLSERAREMYSAEISASEISAPAREDVLGEFSILKKSTPDAERIFTETLYPYVKEEIREREGGIRSGAAHTSSVPDRLYELFDELIKSAESEIFTNLTAKDEERDARLSALRNYYYKIKKFADILARFDSAYKLFIFFENGEIRIKLFCLDTGPVIKERLAKGHGALLFSATLSPLGYYRATLGGDRSDEMLEVNSPFDPSQLSVTIMDKISTRFSERDDTLGAVCRVIAATVSAKRGNYMIFSPSFAYSEALSKAFAAKYPKLHIITQKKNMTAKEKAEFLKEFKKEDSSYLVAFCVMGGIYSEGIDLAGDSLIGAVIVGIGIPALSYEREAIAEYYEEKYEEGKQYAYVYPGMNRVFQAAGRVIRTEEDKGVIVLIDDRFDDPIYKKSLPKLWEGVKFIGDAKTLREELDEFWKN